jgi:hypothetical protein
MKFKLIAALLGLGLTIAIPGAVVAQISDDQVPDQYSKPSAGIPMQGPNDQASMDQGPNDQGSNDQGPNGQGSMNQGPTQPGSNDQGYASQTASAPAETNGVARVSLIHGDVSTQRGDTSSWSAAALNAPVLAGDRVSTGDNARTELQLDYANMLRLAEHSQANINTLTRSQIQIQLGRGMANYSVFKNSDADAEIDTPNVAIRTNRGESSFRILVTADDHTEVLVRKGEVEITTPQGGTRVGEGQFITVQGAGDQAQYKIGEAPARDDWDQWNTDRDNVIHHAASRRHTNDYYVGAEDLDNHGTWSEVPDYGQVWRPTETDPDWAPYRNGHWVSEPYWGWTWVSYDDWGWAPYHYGRWMNIDGGWGWWPGPAYGNPFYQPIWAPAYVSFFGVGGGLGFGYGGGWGSVGWLPLGPCDFFHPWWGRWGGRFGDRDIRGVNRGGGFAPLHGGTRFSNVNLAMHDQHFRGGTTVSGRESGTGRMHAQPMSHAQFQNARFSTGRLPMTPGRESFSASGRAAAPSTTRNVAQNQHFFSARGASGTASRSLERGQGRGQSQMSNGNRQAGGFTGNGREVARPGNTSSNSGSPRFSQNSEPRGNSRGNSNWGSAPRPGNSAGSMPARDSRNGNGGGWQRFSPMPPRSSSGSRSSEPAGRPSMGGADSYGSGSPRGSYASPRSSGPASRSYGPEGRGYSGSSSTRSEPAGRPSMGGSENRGSYGSPRGSYGSPRSAGPSGRSYSPESRGYSGSSRPQLNMRQPIVAPRSYGRPSYDGNRGGYSGGGRPAPGYGGGGRSAPSYQGGGGGHSAPSGGRSAPSGGGGGHSAPSGGSSHGGGGGGSRHGR